MSHWILFSLLKLHVFFRNQYKNPLARIFENPNGQFIIHGMIMTRHAYVPAQLFLGGKTQSEITTGAQHSPSIT